MAATVAALTTSELPGSADFETLMPPVARAWVRRVTGFNLWVFYVFDDAEVTIVTVTNRPPVPIEP